LAWSNVFGGFVIEILDLERERLLSQRKNSDDQKPCKAAADANTKQIT